MAVTVEIQKLIQSNQPIAVCIEPKPTKRLTVTVTMDVEGESRDFVLISPGNSTPRGPQHQVVMDCLTACTIVDWGDAKIGDQVTVKAVASTNASDKGRVII